MPLWIAVQVVANRDSASQQIAMLQETINKLRVELLQYKQGKREVCWRACVHACMGTISSVSVDLRVVLGR